MTRAFHSYKKLSQIFPKQKNNFAERHTTSATKFFLEKYINKIMAVISALLGAGE